MDTSACLGSSRDENSNERTAETSSKRKLVDDIEKPDAKKSKMNSSVLQKQGELQLR